MFISVFIGLTIFGKAQFLDTIKSLTNKKPNIGIRLESRFSFLRNELVKVSGFRVGLIFQKKLKVGIGYSWLRSNVSDDLEIINSLGNKEIVKNYLKFGYVAYYTDFVFYKTKRWQLSVPLQLGTGLAWFQYVNNNAKVESKKHILLLYEPGISVQFKLTRWVGLGTDIGYRFTLKNTKRIGEKLNSPTYGFKLMLWFDQLFYLIAPTHELSKKYGPAEW
ncbi:MAG: hypothetical protein ACK504_00670 [Bacteroidota bacterium]